MYTYWYAYCRAVTIYQYVAILQFNIVQYSSIHLLRHTSILRRAIYCSILQHIASIVWTGTQSLYVNVDKLLFSLWKPKAINLLVVLRLAEHILSLPVTGLLITSSVCIAIQQYIVSISHSINNMPICCIVTVLLHIRLHVVNLFTSDWIPECDKLLQHIMYKQYRSANA